MVWNGMENGMEWNGNFGMEYGRCQNGMEWKISRMEWKTIFHTSIQGLREGVQGLHRIRVRVQVGPGLEGPEELRLSRQVLDQIFFSLALHPSLILGKK